MAPEVFAYNQYAEQCDTYSWAIVFWQLLSKQLLPYGNQGKGMFRSTTYSFIQQYLQLFLHSVSHIHCSRETSPTETKSLSRIIHRFAVSRMAFGSERTSNIITYKEDPLVDTEYTTEKERRIF